MLPAVILRRTSASPRWNRTVARRTATTQRIADMGVRYSNLHTAALCSPTRASLRTGRNATRNGTGQCTVYLRLEPHDIINRRIKE